MSSHVCGHRRALRKLSATNFARKRLLTRMRAQVSRQISRLSKSFVAFVTFVRLLSGMRSHVGLERAWSRVSFITYATSIHSICVRLTAICQASIH